MNKKILIFLLFVIGGFFFRVSNYYLFPVFGETSDESAWTLLGSSILQEKVPASWSYFQAYDNYVYKTGVYDAPIVRPVFDHPPLFSFFPGLAHTLRANWIESPSAKVIRLPMVIIGAINVGIFWLVAKKFFKERKWAAITTILFMTIPEIVFGSRLVVAENLIVTWILLALLAILYEKKKWSLSLLFWVSVFSILTKISGIVVPVSICALAVLQKEKKWFKVGFFGAVTGVAVFALYGAFYNWELFLSVLQAQSTRELGLATFQNRFFIHPTLVHHLFFDGWKILGLFATFFILQKTQKKYRLLQFFSLINILFIISTAGETTFHGWYDFVLWPSFVLAIGSLFKEIYEKKLYLLSGLVWILLLPLLRMVSVFGDYNLSLWGVRGAVSLGFTPLFFESISFKKTSQRFLVLFFGLLIILNIFVVFSITHTGYWNQAEFFSSNMPKVR
ncbi:MAG: hypothetical protein HN981_00120 [Candidatus Pacebacteria bacterium]|jgi:hypothetical protein|nr:hypothetical protein [Candidatus Paceibacterota bacterium]MBT6756023.1 hypothetical protein [Candidatus Paceibacterota bacterium]MBT6920789.1 hypothetical protein [Candidatus Paceibacterota bacterium]